MTAGHYAKKHESGKPMALSQKCTRNGCNALALVTPKILVPVLGHPHYMPFEALLDIQVCVPHFAELRVADYLTKLLRGGCKHIMRQVGAEPDFDNARLKPLHIISKEFLRFQKEQRGEAPSAHTTIVWDGLTNGQAWLKGGTA